METLPGLNGYPEDGSIVGSGWEDLARYVQDALPGTVQDELPFGEGGVE